MKKLIGILLIYCSATLIYGAFPIKENINNHDLSIPNKIQRIENQNNLIKEFDQFKDERYAKRKKIVKQRDNEQGWFGVASFLCSTVGMFGFPIIGLGLLSFFSMIAAIVLGAMSFNKKNKGFGIAGFALALTVFIIALAALVAIIIAFGNA